MKTKEKNWLGENLFGIVFLAAIIVGLIFWGAVGTYMFKSYKRASAEKKAMFNSFCEYVTDKDIEYIEPINKGTSLYTRSGGAVVKLYGEEPRTFEGLSWSTEVSTDDKYHVAIQYNSAIVYVPLNNTVDFISN